MAEVNVDLNNVFSVAIHETLRIWPVLTLARQQGFGGRNSQSKEQWLLESILQIFKENELVYPDELEDFLAEVLFNEFDTIVEDGSTKEISTRLCAYYDLCRTSQTDKLREEVKKMQVRQASVTAQRVQEKESSDSSSDEDEEKEQKPSESMEIDKQQDQGSSSKDEDGWEVVRRKKK